MLPRDPYILLSYLNTQLRDAYPSLEEFCAANDQRPEELCAAMARIGYEYDPDRNRFARPRV